MRPLAGKIKILKCDFNSLISKPKNLSKPELVNQKNQHLRALAFSLLSNISDTYLFLFLKHVIR